MSTGIKGRPRRRLFSVGAAAALGAAVLAGQCGGQESGASIDEDRQLTEVEEKFTGRLAAIEQSFSAFIQELQQKFVGRMEKLEMELAPTAMALEKSPGDAALLEKIQEIQKKLDSLGADVESLRETASFSGAEQ